MEAIVLKSQSNTFKLLARYIDIHFHRSSLLAFHLLSYLVSTYFFFHQFSTSRGGHNCKLLISYYEACLDNYSFLFRAVVGCKSLFLVLLQLYYAVEWKTIFLPFCSAAVFDEDVRKTKRKQTNFFQRQWRCRRTIFASIRAHFLETVTKWSFAWKETI